MSLRGVCDRVERALELRMLRDADGSLLAIYNAGADQRFDSYLLSPVDDSGAIELQMVHELPAGETERWSVELMPWPNSTNEYVGAAAQTLVTASGVETCRSAYLVKSVVDGRAR